MKETTTISKRESNKINCRESILKASRRLFTANGYDETKMEDIASRASVSKATVYNYFPDKESLLTGTVQDVFNEMLAQIAAAEEAGQDFFTRLIGAVKTLVLSAAEYPTLTMRISFLNSLPDSSLFGALNPIMDSIYDLIAGAQKEGSLRKDADTGHIREILVGLFYLAVYQWAGRLDDGAITARLECHLEEQLGSYKVDRPE